MELTSGSGEYDVIVVGAGNAGLTAALSAKEHGVRVLVLEKSPQQRRGGNTRYTGGSLAMPYGGIQDLQELVTDLSADEIATLDAGGYSPDEMYNDLMLISEGRADPELAEIIAHEAFPTVKWMVEQGAKWELSESALVRVGDRVKLKAGRVQAKGGGEGLVEMLFGIAEEKGIDIVYQAKAVQLLLDSAGGVSGVKVKNSGGFRDLSARAVVLACGSFGANPQMRAKYLGPGWDTVKIRGSRYSTGEGLEMALRIGAQPAGHWTGCHATEADPAAADMEMESADSSRKGFPWGILVNVEGKRFFDEGEDVFNFTYAKLGRSILAQPKQCAFEIYDTKVRDLLPQKYNRAVSSVTAHSIAELADNMGIDVDGLVRTVNEYNEAVQEGTFDPSIKDGKCTRGIVPPKSNWAQKIDSPPLFGFPVICGLTFTFGGLKINGKAQVLDTEGEPIAGLYATGEITGTFYHNYLGASGLAKGAVFGRIAGANAAGR